MKLKCQTTHSTKFQCNTKTLASKTGFAVHKISWRLAKQPTIQLFRRSPSYHLIVKASWEEVAVLCGLVTIRWPRYTAYHAMMTLGKIQHCLLSLDFINRLAYNESATITKTNVHMCIEAGTKLVWRRRLQDWYEDRGGYSPTSTAYTSKFSHAWNLPVHLSFASVPICFLSGHRVWCDCCPVVLPVHVCHHGTQSGKISNSV